MQTYLKTPSKEELQLAHKDREFNAACKEYSGSSRISIHYPKQNDAYTHNFKASMIKRDFDILLLAPDEERPKDHSFHLVCTTASEIKAFLDEQYKGYIRFIQQGGGTKKERSLFGYN